MNVETPPISLSEDTSQALRSRRLVVKTHAPLGEDMEVLLGCILTTSLLREVFRK